MRALAWAGLLTLVLTWHPRRPRPIPTPPLRAILILLLVELRSGQSVLASIQNAAQALPEHQDLRVVARVAVVSGLTAAIACASNEIRPVIAQLARAQRSGSSLSATVRRLLEDDLTEERSRRLARARSLPTRLMVPVTLLMLPGLVVLLYAPALLGLYRDLIGGW